MRQSDRKQLMPQLKISPFARSIILVLIFFGLGQFIRYQWDIQGIWLIVILLVIYYAVNWILFQRRKNEK